MGHKDAHRSPVPHGSIIAGDIPDTDHHHGGEPDGHIANPVEHVEGNHDALWVDIGGEG